MVCAALFCSSEVALAQAGQLDPTFEQRRSRSGQWHARLRFWDGRDGANKHQWQLGRHVRKLDQNLGTDGVGAIPVAGPTAIALQPDGKILIAAGGSVRVF